MMSNLWCNQQLQVFWNLHFYIHVGCHVALFVTAVVGALLQGRIIWQTLGGIGSCLCTSCPIIFLTRVIAHSCPYVFQPSLIVHCLSFHCVDRDFFPPVIVSSLFQVWLIIASLYFCLYFLNSYFGPYSFWIWLLFVGLWLHFFIEINK